ncbi:MAG: hypothetical protein LRY55_01385, partial [Leadbetterella sp.]|nr:hypothetical protein [Leadbetterella sp.]
MTPIDQSAAIGRMNKAGQDNRPFLFVISYDRTRSYIIPLDETDTDLIRYHFPGNEEHSNKTGVSGLRQAEPDRMA